MSRVLVAGAGAIGQWLGARLHAAGHDATLLLRPVHRDAIVRDGLVVRGLTTFSGRPPCAVDAAGLAGPFDAVFVTAKAHATAQVGAQVAPLLGPDGALVSLQNGLGNAQKLARAAPGRVAVALTSHGVTLEGPGRVHHAGAGTTQVGPAPDGDATAARRAEALLADAGLAPTWHDDMRPAVWTKAAVNAAVNPVAALHGVRNGALVEGPLHDQAVALLDEVAALARAAGVLLPDLRGALDGVLRRTAENKCSMLQDVEARRPTEAEQITGAFVRIARRLGFPLEENERVYRAVKAREASYLGEEAAFALTRAEVDQAVDLLA